VEAPRRSTTAFLKNLILSATCQGRVQAAAGKGLANPAGLVSLQRFNTLKMSQSARRVIRAATALCILVWLVHSVGFSQILEQFQHASVPMLLAATALLAVDGIAKARNWQHLLMASIAGLRLSLFRVLRWHFAGGFVGAIVPSSAGTDACRVWLATRGLPGHGVQCTASIVTVNCLGWFTGSLIGLIGLAILSGDGILPTMLKPAVLLFLGTLACLPLAYGVLASKRAWADKLIEKARGRSEKLADGMTQFLNALLVFEQTPGRFLMFVLVSAGGLLAQTGMFELTAAAVGIDLPFAVWMVLVPLTRIVALVPATIADFGLIQAAHVSVLTLFGVPPSQSFALSALFAVEGLLIHSTVGSSAFLLGGRNVATVPDPAAFQPRRT
jgi:uncharacterized protein (TIRG00374 family)